MHAAAKEEAAATPASSPESTVSSPRRLARALFFFGLSGALPKVIGFLLIPLYTAYLTPADYGVLELAATFSPLLIVGMRLGVPGAISRYYYEYPEGPDLRDYVTTIARVLEISSALVGLLAAGLLWQFGDLLTPGMAFTPYGALVVVTCVLSSQVNVQNRLILVREQSQYAAKLSTSMSLIGILLAIAMVAGLEWGATGILYSQALAGLGGFAVARYYLRHDLKGRFRFGLLKESLNYASGVFPSHLIGTAAPFAVRALVAAYASTEALGMLGLANRFCAPLVIATAALTKSYVPIYFSLRKGKGEHSTADLADLADLGGRVWTGAVTLTLAVALAGPWLLRVMTPLSFHEAANLIPLLSAGALAQIIYFVVGPELFFLKRPWPVSVTALANAVVTISVTAVLLNPLGVVGLGIAMFGGWMASAVVAGWFTSRIVQIPHRWGPRIAMALVALGLAALPLLLPQDGSALELGLRFLLGLVFLVALVVIRDPLAVSVVGWVKGRLGVAR